MDGVDQTLCDLPSGYVNSLLLKMAIEIVDLPIIIKDIEDGDFP